MITDEWTKSSYSNGEGGNCVEARGDTADACVLVRDTQNRGLGHLAFDAGEWSVLLNTLTAR